MNNGNSFDFQTYIAALKQFMELLGWSPTRIRLSLEAIAKIPQEKANDIKKAA